LTKEDIAQEYDFTWRQAGYYSDAAIYLDLVERDREQGISVYKLTERGIAIFNSHIFDRKIQLIELILNSKIFNEVLKMYFENGNISTKKEIVKMMSDADLYNIKSNKTFIRRSSTVLGWIRWIMSVIEE
jgi:predicted transcriptional regulator with HTH domain